MNEVKIIGCPGHVLEFHIDSEDDIAFDETFTEETLREVAELMGYEMTEVELWPIKKSGKK